MVGSPTPCTSQLLGGSPGSWFSQTTGLGAVLQLVVPDAATVLTPAEMSASAAMTLINSDRFRHGLLSTLAKETPVHY
jgi:hypothetical protein